jgi:hypothetical protein
MFGRSIPAAAEAAIDFCGSYGTAEAVPFQGRFKLSHYAQPGRPRIRAGSLRIIS